MAKQNEFRTAMKDMGTPREMSPANDITNPNGSTPIVEVNQPLETQDMLEYRDPAR